MKKTNRITFFTTIVVLAYLLSACSGVPAGVKVDDSSSNSQSQAGQGAEVAFTGTIDAMGGNQWTISGQAITVDGATSVAANIVVGDNVKVEARVSQDGTITAVRIEHAGNDNANGNSNDDNQNDSNTNDNGANSNDDLNGNSNGNGNGNDNSSAVDDKEVSGVVEAITTDSITIDGVVYMIADFSEFKDLVGLGDMVKVHVIVNADGTVTIREIEKTQGAGLEDNNSNSNGSDDNANSNDDDGSNSNDNSNGNNNTNDDHGNDNGGGSNNNDSSGSGNGNGNG